MTVLGVAIGIPAVASIDEAGEHLEVCDCSASTTGRRADRAPTRRCLLTLSLGPARPSPTLSGLARGHG
jgi:hypothetical protein